MASFPIAAAALKTPTGNGYDARGVNFKFHFLCLFVGNVACARPHCVAYHACLYFFFFGLSHVIQLTPQQQSAEPKNSAGAEALAVARRPHFTLYVCF